MILVFRRTGERRYAVEARRSGFPDVEMDPAPGYHPLMPHDMMHLVVEAQLGLRRGIFGQLAAGGGTFRLSVKSDEKSRQVARARRRVSVRGKKMFKAGRDECIQSERATYICMNKWLARLSCEEKRQAPSMRQQVRDTGLSALNQRKLDEICEHLDHLSSHWSRLRAGESMAITWPELAIVTQP